jgi:hypothetical protein
VDYFKVAFQEIRFIVKRHQLQPSKDSLWESKRTIDSAVYAAATVCWLSWTACNDAPNSSTEGSVRNELSIVAGDEHLTNEMSELLWSKSA